jgi:hypothetical protein
MAYSAIYIKYIFKYFNKYIVNTVLILIEYWKNKLNCF